MLRHIPKLLSPDLLHALAAMGHGDDIVIADANFPATAIGKSCIYLPGVSATDMLEAVLTVMPLDHFAPSAHTMQVVGEPDAVPEIVGGFQTIIDEIADRPTRIMSVERFAFYEMAKQAFVVVQTGEERLYGNIVLKKGVIGK